MSLSTEARERNANLCETIRTVPFNRELAVGTLSNGRFQHYIVQDAHCLLAYARVYTVAAAKANTSDLMVTMADWPAGTVPGEQMHEAFHRAMQLEWVFRDRSWRLETWPVT